VRKLVHISRAYLSVVSRGLRSNLGQRRLFGRTLAQLFRGYPGGTHTDDLITVRYPSATSGAYYQRIHEINNAYKLNNWLVPEIESILSISPRSILEVGCGNGRFLAAVSGRVDRVIGIDWARSPILDEIGGPVIFERADITRDALPKADIVCSADVLEHIAPDLLQSTVQRLHRAGFHQYHVIACYDDGHSHLSIMEPEAWLGLFKALSPKYQIIDIRQRANNPSRVICVIATFQPKTVGAPHLSA
jgi:SAM-dependent methyltransferase